MGMVGRGGVQTTRRLGGTRGGTSLAAGGAVSSPATRLVKSAVRNARRRVRERQRRVVVMVVPVVGTLGTLRDTGLAASVL